MEQPQKAKPPLINCHTHIFTSDHVPPWLAKTFLFWPAYKLFHVGFIVRIIKWWYKYPDRLKYKDGYKRLEKIGLATRFFFIRLGFLYQLIGWFLTVQAFFIIYDWLKLIIAPDNAAGIKWIENARDFLIKYNLYYSGDSLLIKIGIILFILFFFKWGRNLIIFIFKKLWKFFGMLPGKQTYALVKRYLNIGRFSFYGTQAWVFGKLRDQYPEGTGFVVLPMDMEFMDAGKTKASYKQQMEDLAAIKKDPDNQKLFFPFVFVDPRRVEAEKKSFFDYSIDSGGKQALKDCFIKRFIEEEKFSGFKIYPALGYFPFEESLLPIWKYAADNQIPVLTHCIKGTIFYRGDKHANWNKHKVFKQSFGGGAEPLLLPETENEKFSWNFTHPLNFLCLLKEKLLREIVGGASNEIKELFGFTNLQTPLKHNLSELKICLGHFGGDDQWDLFMERDRDNFSSELLEDPNRGIEFFVNRKTGKEIPFKIEQVWKYTDWYSIICSLMLQYDNVYSDLSYIIHNNGIRPLLKAMLREENIKLRSRILYGTDFYVVRNHKSERNMLVDSLTGLSDEEFDLIARENPRKFLFNTVHGPLPI